MAKVVEIMTALCSFFPGADTPINYDDCEDDDTEYSEDEYMTYDSRDSLPTDTDTMHDPAQSNRSSEPVLDQTAPRPRSFVETQVSKLQNLMAAEATPKTSAVPDEPDAHRIGPVRIPQQFKRERCEGRSPAPGGGPSDVTAHDALAAARSPLLFSEGSSPRRLSPIANYNIGNMNPRHIDIEQYWNRENDKLSPRSPSVISNSNSLRKEDYNQNYCDRLSATNSPVPPMKYNGNLSQRPVDPRYQTPLQIEVDPNSWELLDVPVNYDYGEVRNTAGFDKYYTVGNSSGSTAGEGGAPAPAPDPALDAMHMMLDPHLRPISPDLSNDESKRIFEEHKQLAQEYLKIQTEFAYLSNHKSELEGKMDEEELRQKREIIQLENEKDSLIKLYCNLKEQLSRVESDAWIHPEEMPHE